MGFKNSLGHIGPGIDLSDRLRIQEALPQKGLPLLLHLDNSVARPPGPRIELHRDRGEETTAGEYAPLQVCKKGIHECPELLQSRWRRGGPKHFTLKNVGSDLNCRQFEFFFGLEVGVEPALAHADLGGQVANRQAVEALRGRQLRGGEQNGGATQLAFRGTRFATLRTIFFVKNGVHVLTIARTVVIINSSYKNERSFFYVLDGVPAGFSTKGHAIQPFGTHW